VVTDDKKNYSTFAIACCVNVACCRFVVGATESLYAKSPIPTILLPKELPTPTRPTDDRNSGVAIEISPVKKKREVEVYKVIGMYDNMLKMVQIKRYWPIETRYDGCVMLHNYNWICP
jgi:hypothetical protein